MNSPSQTPKKTGAHCSECKRRISARESLEQGRGPVCAEHHAARLVGVGTSVEEIAALSAVPEAARWIHFFNRAVAARNRKDAERFLEAARRASLPPTGELQAA